MAGTLDLLNAATKPKPKTTAEALEETTSVETSTETKTVDAAAVKKMKMSEVEALHASGDYGVIEDWDQLSINQKKDALIAAINGEVGEAEIIEQVHSPDPEDLVEVQEPVAEEAQTGKAKAKTGKKKDVAGGDLIAATVNKVENIGDEVTAHKQLHALIENNSAWEFEVGAYLAKIQAQGWFGGHPNFQAFVENETPLHKRKAYNLVEIYTGLVESGVSWEKVGHLGWTKVLVLIPVLSVETVDEWVAKANDISYNQLKADVQAYLDAKAGGGPAPITGPSENVVSSLTFKVHKDQKETIDLALEKAMKAGNTEIKSVALEYIATDFLAGTGKKAPKAAELTPKQVAQTMDVKDIFAALKELAGDNVLKIAEAVLDAYGEVFPEVDIQVLTDFPS